MLFELAVSLFGIVIVQRILSLLEKIEVLRAPNLKFFSLLLQFPLYLPLFFKELLFVTGLYIGIFTLTLILSSKIIVFFQEITFEKLHLSIINRVLLHISTGKSPQTSLKAVMNSLSSFESAVFATLTDDLYANLVPSVCVLPKKMFYFTEMRRILRSEARITEQLQSFRRSLQLQNNLRRKSRQASLQTRAQAVICALLYASMLYFAVRFLSFNLVSFELALSLTMFLSGQMLIFKMGASVRWKT